MWWQKKVERGSVGSERETWGNFNRWVSTIYMDAPSQAINKDALSRVECQTRPKSRVDIYTVCLCATEISQLSLVPPPSVRRYSTLLYYHLVYYLTSNGSQTSIGCCQGSSYRLQSPCEIR